METIIVVILWLIKYLTSFFLTIKSNAQGELKCSQETFESDSCFFIMYNEYFPRETMDVVRRKEILL